MGIKVTADAFDAVLFDLDGVITRTARLHAGAWKQAFDEFLSQRQGSAPITRFDKDADYTNYVDGKPRYAGVQGFLDSRGIVVDPGDPSDPPGKATVWGIANRKNALFEQALREDHVEVYDGTLRWIRHLRGNGIKVAAVSSSRHCAAILDNAGIAGLFDVRVDGTTAARLGLRGKPAPDLFLKAAERLGVRPERAVVVEDALAGVEAGRAGGFGLVIGVDRGNGADALHQHGAGVVVSDLAEMLVPSS